MTNNTSIAIVFLAVVILIIGAPFALNEYSKWQERLFIVAQTPAPLLNKIPTPKITVLPTVTPDPVIFNKHWCRDEGAVRRCYSFFANHSYAYGSTDSHAEVLMDDQWTLISKNKYAIPGQVFSYYDGALVTTLNPSFGPYIYDAFGHLRDNL